MNCVLREGVYLSIGMLIFKRGIYGGNYGIEEGFKFFLSAYIKSCVRTESLVD